MLMKVFLKTAYIYILLSRDALKLFSSMVQDVPGFVKSHLTKIIFEKIPMQPPSLKNPTNENTYICSEKWFYTDIVFILNEENKLQYLK